MKHVEKCVKKWQFHVIKLRQFFPFLAFCKRPDNGKFESWYSDELTTKNAITAFADADKTAGQSRNYRVITHNTPLTQRHKYYINIIFLWGKV